MLNKRELTHRRFDLANAGCQRVARERGVVGRLRIVFRRRYDPRDDSSTRFVAD
jgi:hypothetical protein